MTVRGQHYASGSQAGVRIIRANTGSRAIQRLPKRDVRPGWIAILLAALLAFSWQSFVTQTHEHFGSGTYSAVAGAKTATPQMKGGRSPTNPPDTCPICREIAQAGHYLLPTSVAFHTPETITHWLTVTPSLVLALCLRSHAWLSRAPPIQLQA